ncbi:MAG: D-tyrosyl-tRNA(Tyr) deacylase [Ruminococcaceae bacterium]|nr:D-tyrosyl-tRNA(Tyr) deacylase [Oscillospiraceae bacterium]
MKAVIQLVEDCVLTIDDSTLPFSEIDKGLFVLLGVDTDDNEADAEKLARKIATLRIFADADGKMNLSCTDEAINGKFMVVSQFTLCGDCSHGRRPNMFAAARPEVAEPLYEHFSKVLNEECQKYNGTSNNYVVNGKFGADMKIKFTNVGPVTFVIESDELK